MIRTMLVCFAITAILSVNHTLSAQQALPPLPQAEPVVPGTQPEETELTRGPIHEAFAQPFEPKSGGEFIVTQTPPEPIEEYPPNQLPESSAYQWVSGYWGWEPDEERFIWISGTWRLAPENMVWSPGYWVEVEGGHTWVSGSWVKEGEVYLMAQVPPDSREENPGEPPSAQHFWVPGHWIENQGGFSWNSGFWSRAYAGRVWIPFRYVWTPEGYLVANGYWDYALEDRGVLYSPVEFDQVPGPTYRYTPNVITRVDYLPTHLFVYRNYGHYCFGDYYNYNRPGVFISWTSRNYRSYDPLRLFFFSFHRDRFDHHRNRHDYYHDHADHRPKHTWNDQRNHSERHRDDDDFKSGKYKDAFVSAGANSWKKGDGLGSHVRIGDDNQKRWQEIAQKNDRDRQLKKQHEENLKKLSKSKSLDGRFQKDSNASRSRITTIGPLNIRTKEKSSDDRSGRTGNSGRLGSSGRSDVVISPGKDKKDERLPSSRFVPGNTKPPAYSGRNTNTSDALKRLREQNEKIQKESNDRARKEADQRNNIPKKENDNRSDLLKKQIEEARRRQSQSSGNRSQPTIRLPSQKSQQPNQRKQEPKREIKLPTRENKQPSQNYKKPERSSSSSNSANKPKSSNSSKGKAPSRRPSSSNKSSKSSKKKKD
ncbi:MAG: hypothetical protein P8M30_21250 [Planctomycetaceae bacterium]|nr:hypothetical protein [Planctomycetaceae bacterium]MDG2391840.1 hypothetical protein [Planctomycetaceae bacterium]